MENPFRYSGIVSGDAFCNRSREQSDLLKYIKASQNVLIYSHRRYGKTSLILKIFETLKRQKPKVSGIHIDLYGTTTEKDFVTTVFRSLGQIEKKIEKLMLLARSVLQNVNVNFSMDPVTALPSMSVSFGSDYEEILLDNVLGVLEKLSEKRKLVVVFDEFQEIANYVQNEFEKRLRKSIQKHKNICYIFSGSQRHILSEIFNDSHRAFYKLAESYPISKIETKYYIPWSKNLFAKNGVKLDTSIITEIVSRCEQHPMYVQQFLFHLWDERILTSDNLEKIEQEILQRNENEFLNRWESLTLNQKKTLKLIVATGGHDIFSANAMREAGLRSASQVTRALETIVKKDIVSKNDRYQVQDIMFKKWIKKFL